MGPMCFLPGLSKWNLPKLWRQLEGKQDHLIWTKTSICIVQHYYPFIIFFFFVVFVSLGNVHFSFVIFMVLKTKMIKKRGKEIVSYFYWLFIDFSNFCQISSKFGWIGRSDPIFLGSFIFFGFDIFGFLTSPTNIHVMDRAIYGLGW